MCLGFELTAFWEGGTGCWEYGASLWTGSSNTHCCAFLHEHLLNTVLVPSSSGQSSCPEGALLSRHTAINSQHPGPMGYNQNSTPSHHPHPHPPHPAPNAHSSPWGSQKPRVVQYTLNRSPAFSFDEEPDGLSYEPQQPPLPEKMRTLDCDRSLGSVSPAPSGFSSPHSGSSLSIPFPNSLPDLQTRTTSVSPLPGTTTHPSHDAPVLSMSWGLKTI